MNHDPIPLTRLLHDAATELAAQPAPPLPRAVLDALPRSAASRPAASVGPRPRARGWAALHGVFGARLGTVAAAFAVLLLSVTVLLMLAPASRPVSEPSGALAAAGFLPVAPQERWARLQAEGGAAWVVTTELPQARLAGYGLPFDPSRAADTVRAELLMRASGEVLAVRVLY